MSYAPNQSIESEAKISPFVPPAPTSTQQQLHFGRLYGTAPALVIDQLSRAYAGLVVVVVPDMTLANRLETELQFFAGEDEKRRILSFPDWETLPYDVFSPHQDIISQRLLTLYALPQTTKGILIVPVSMLMQRVAPRNFIQGNSLILKVGDTLNLDEMRRRLESSGYRYVSQVMEHGEFAVRGSILDLFPSGQSEPIRIDLLDDEVESIRMFDAETQRTIKNINEVSLLPAREFPFTEQAIKHFRQAFREQFEGDPQTSLIYRDVSNGNIPSGIEYYQPLFFSKMETLFDYYSPSTLFVRYEGDVTAATTFSAQVEQRYEQRRHDIERRILAPDALYLHCDELESRFKQYRQITLQSFSYDNSLDSFSKAINFATQKPPKLTINPRIQDSTLALKQFVADFTGRVLFAAETEGRREALLAILRDNDFYPTSFPSWEAFQNSDSKLGIAIAPLEDGMLLENPAIAIISEPQLFGERVQQRRRRRSVTRDTDAIIKNLTELSVGAPIVHHDHGVGRYLGLQTLNIGDIETEFLTLEYANGDKLYVPVSSLHLVSRYTGASPETAPLHKLGTDQWDKIKRKAAESAHDVAAELLEIYARREAAQGRKFKVNREEYAMFAASFPFEETPDQEAAIQAVVEDMQKQRPMDRLVCGDVGFGKTEVAMRAAFIAANDGAQVAVLVPTTLLAQQHYQNFKDRFADWPFRIEVVSRFKSKKEQTAILKSLADGKIDIIIGTHKLLGEDIKFSNLGLVAIDEEHRFGVRQKEKLKAMVANVDLLALTATPIPRTLNMSLSGLRDLSIIATPPSQRLAVKTFVAQWDNEVLKEAFQRELKRGGQIYFLHNDVETIERTARELSALLPEIKVNVAHGQMRERDLEQVMLDFYHRRFNVLVCTTIIESGIDIPTANTIVINRADKLGLAQLHQLRGRVGRSHHRAYAYLIVPPPGAMSADAVKRLEAIESLEDLGAGFMLATHDMEIRGAGELLGEGQSGQIHEVGFSMYSELLERAVKALKEGKQPELDRPLDHGAEVDLHVPALIPDDYLPDVHARLTMYKRIASCENEEALRELQVEMIDRFGLFPPRLKTLIQITELKLMANPLGILKIDGSVASIRIAFAPKPNIEPIQIIKLIQSKPGLYKLDGADKIRINIKTDNLEQRVKVIEDTLKYFAKKN